MAEIITLGSVQAPYLEQTLTIPAGGTRKFDYAYDSFNLLDADIPGVLEVTFGGAAVQSRFAAGMAFKLSEPVSFIQFYNKGNAPLTIHYALAIGEIKDNRLTVSGNVQVVPADGVVFPAKKAGFTNYQAGSNTGSSTLPYDANSQIDFLCTSGTITLDNAAGVSALILSAGQTWSACLADAGTMTISGTGSYNFSVGDWN